MQDCPEGLIDKAVGAEELEKDHADENLSDQVAGKEAESKEISEMHSRVI